MHRAIALTGEETALLNQIRFDAADIANPAEHHANGNAVVALLRLLHVRRPIPVHRQSCFTDPAYNVGGHGKSRQQIFEGNGCHGEQIARHAHFLPHLCYMLFGAKLPAAAIAEFEEAVVECGEITSGDALILSDAAKKIARAHYLDGAAAEEFYKLALDAGLDVDFARHVRDAVRPLK